ncbi:MAG TPA: RIP metalloprotease RseP [Chitinophagaceae bacterium]|jgi:regulator of sigma E protease|nr:RIP metalloprotease RseP [Chitinophagaceae bacterium]HPH23639.1 RIP metalloprotease RseP [Chitinophagaceae bacterium]
MTLLAIDWSGGLVQAGQFILSFSILVVLHELGHFFPAKWFKCRVEKFYLFFNPWFSLWKKKIGDTEWGIGWVPFGGYVKIVGMVDESMDKEQMKLPPAPDEFRAKPAWQRLIIMLGGVTVNVILAIVIFIGISWYWGEEYLPAKNLKYGIVADSLGKTIGLQNGDIITKVGNEPVKNAIDVRIVGLIVLSDAQSLTIERDGKEMQLPYGKEFVKALNKSRGDGFIGLRFPFIIDGFAKLSTAEHAGIKKGDQLIAVDGVPTPFFNDYQAAVKGKKGGKINLTVIRNVDTLMVPVELNNDGKMGVQHLTNLPKMGFVVENKTYTFFEAIPVGYNKCWESLDKYISGIKQLFNGKANPNDSLGSVLSIGSVYSKVWDWQSFWTLTALFSIILAFMNILPIPALDGGHALFCIFEMITGRKPSDKFMEYAQTVGMVLLLGLMVYALGLDFWRLFK